MLISPKSKATEVQSRHHCRTLDFRGQDRLMQSDTFLEAWGRADESERRDISKLFNDPSPMQLKSWILKVLVGGLGQFPIKILRQLASFHQIKNYSRMTRIRLLNDLNKKGVKDDSKNVQRNNS